MNDKKQVSGVGKCLVSLPPNVYEAVKALQEKGGFNSPADVLRTALLFYLQELGIKVEFEPRMRKGERTDTVEHKNFGFRNKEIEDDFKRFASLYFYVCESFKKSHVSEKILNFTIDHKCK